MADTYEARQRILGPDRKVEQRHARQEAEDRLRKRGIWVHTSDDDVGVADLLDSIERFETTLDSLGIPEYRLRVEAATDRLLHGRHRS